MIVCGPIMQERHLAAASAAMATRLLLFLLLVNSVPRTSASDDGPLMHHVMLDQHGHYIMTWTPEETHVTLEVQVKTRGWIGLGFSYSGNMEGADMVMAWIDEAGEVHLTDRHGIGFVTPVIDDSQDVELIHGFNNATHTTIRFRRAWDTCDKKDDFVITSDTIRVMWAYNDVVPASELTATFRHDHRGVKSLFMMEPRTAVFEETEDIKYFDVFAPDVVLPHNVTTLYWCKLIKLPPLEQKNHLIGHKSIITPGNEAYVHHMLLYECAMEQSERYLEPWVSHNGAQCYSPNMPVSWRSCSSPIIGWAVGGEGQALPDHVGLPLGEDHSGATYFMLEIHYDNTDKVPGVVDSSGFRVFHTEKLREYEAGFLLIGHVVEPLQLIGPNQPWTTVGHCTADCTSKVLPKEGITVLSSFLHTHLLGRGITVHHIRDGKELPPLFEDKHYDFNYQEIRVLHKERKILPGDHLYVECTYDSTGIYNPTFGGLATQDEMCLTGLMYYPRLDLAQCWSRPNKQELLASMGVKELYRNKDLSAMDDYILIHNMVDEEKEQKLMEQLAAVKPGTEVHDFRFFHMLHMARIKEPQALQGMSLLQLLFNPKFWTNETTARIQHVIIHGKIDARCDLRKGKKVVGFQGSQEIPVFEPFVPDEEHSCTARQRMGLSSVGAEQGGAGNEKDEGDEKKDDESKKQGGDDDGDGDGDKGVRGGRSVFLSYIISLLG